MRSIADEILYVMSARRVMPWTTFREAFDHLCEMTPTGERLGLEQTRRVRRQVAENLDSLGHCDFDFSDNPLVYVAPPTLARLPYTTSEAVLCGARTPGTVTRLSQVVGEIEPHCQLVVEEGRHRLALAPARILVRCPSPGHLEMVAAALGIAFSPVPPAWLFANLAPSVDDLAENRNWRAAEEPNWPLRDFDAETCTFRIRAGDRGREPRLTSYRNPRTNRHLTMIWADGRCADIDREWGRYWLLSKKGKFVLRYDERHLILSVPVGAPLPRLYARALALCSGAPRDGVEDPEEHARDLRVHYRGVPPQIAHTIRDKLGQVSPASNPILVSKV